VLALVFEDEPYGPLPYFLGVPRLSVHGSILSRVGASRKPGAVHFDPDDLSVTFCVNHYAANPVDPDLLAADVSLVPHPTPSGMTLREVCP
jgi:hypothetical protein